MKQSTSTDDEHYKNTWRQIGVVITILLVVTPVVFVALNRRKRNLDPVTTITGQGAGVTALMAQVRAAGAPSQAIETRNPHEKAETPALSTPLIQAAGSGDLEAVKALIVKGADVNEAARGMHGFTPLIAAIAMGGTPEVIDTLLRSGANPNLRDRNGMTALMWAVGHGDGYTNVVRLLIKMGADVNQRQYGDRGDTALDCARTLANVRTTEIRAILERSCAK